MESLFKILPPFAPDYSGVCSALFELGGILVVHDGGGCTGNFTGYDEPRWYGSTGAVFSSGLREIDAVVGDDAKLLRKLENAVHDLGGRFIAIIGSPAPMVIGTDYEALARLLSQKLKLPVLTFDTNGLGYYDAGASRAFLELARRFVKPAASRIEAGVNIIGAIPLDVGRQPLQQLSSLLTAAGCEIVSCWSMGSGLDDIESSANARLNIVVSGTGLESARYLELEHGIPYITGIPIGRAPTDAFVRAVRSLLGISAEKIVFSKENKSSVRNGGMKSLVIGEQLLGNSIRNCLRADTGVADIAVASFFGMDPAFRESGDMRLTGEDSLTDLVRAHSYEIIVGDPLYHDLIVSASDCRFIRLPHIAVSGRLYWDYEFDYIGEEGLRFFESNLADSEK
jgi:nitrogenase molybdenum-cofactor synthesis protein NifE